MFKAVGSKHIEYPSTRDCKDKYENNTLTDKVSYKTKNPDLILQGNGLMVKFELCKHVLLRFRRWTHLQRDAE